MEVAIVLYVIFGILGLVLFFKIWGMTNDIRELKNSYYRENDVALPLSSNKAMKKLKYNILLGNLEFAKKELMENFVSVVEKNIPSNRLGKIDYSKTGESIRPYVEMLECQFAKFGEELPGYVKNMQTFDDYLKLISYDDFNIKSK